jgi:phosphatidylglycerophosphate synthase
MSGIKQYITKGKDYYYSRIIRNASVTVALKLKKTNISPEQIVLLGLVPGTAALFLYARGTYPAVLLGSFCYALAWFMDFVDGDLARLTNRVSERGEWLDSLSGRIIEMLVYFGVCFGLSKHLYPVRVWIIGFAVIALHHIIVSLMSKETIISLKAQTRSPELRPDLQEKKKKIGHLRMLLRELTAGPDMNGFFIILGGAFNLLYWSLWLCLVYNFCYLVLRLKTKINEYFLTKT